MKPDIKVVPDAPAQFEAAVIKRFRFLEESGFKRLFIRTDRHVAAARYENGFIYVNLVYGPPAYEPEMSFGRLGMDDIQGGFSFEAGDLIQLASCNGWKKPVEGTNSIERQVTWLAKLLSDCGRQCLLGDAAIYAEMKLRRQALLVEWRRAERINVENQQIESAWKKKDYRLIIQILDTYSGVLSKINKRRLEIAKTKI